MDLYEVMRTTFSARQFSADPLPDETLYRILDNARFASSGANNQGWRVIVVRDPNKRRALADLCKPAFSYYKAQLRAGEVPFNTVTPTQVDRAQGEKEPHGYPLLDNFHDPSKLPVLLVVTLDLSLVTAFDAHLPRIGVISGASIYPFVWNILLAARNEGFGGVLTTFLSDKEIEAQRLLGIPKHFAVAAMLPLGKPVKQLTKLSRKPVESFTTIDAFNGERFVGR
ncbi:MAG: nitroreductase family protein [Gammaproteobacteria bacterium]